MFTSCIFFLYQWYNKINPDQHQYCVLADCQPYHSGQSIISYLYSSTITVIIRPNWQIVLSEYISGMIIYASLESTADHNCYKCIQPGIVVCNLLYFIKWSLTFVDPWPHPATETAFLIFSPKHKSRLMCVVVYIKPNPI